MKQFLFSCILVAFLGNNAHAQETGPLRSQVEPLPQVFTPTAAGLGQYGKVPVSYFNGLPNITIPLTELKGKNYDLPVFLTYHADGNKPDEHAGPVGLGWSLHVGGCINRIVNGLKDECDGDEFYFFKETHHYGPSAVVIPEPPDPGDQPYNPLYLGPGLFYNWETYNETDWCDQESIDAFAQNDDPQDFEPDEFIVFMEGLSASFYFDGPNGIRIVSQTAEEFKVDYQLDSSRVVTLFSTYGSQLKAHLFTYIKTLTLTKGDGICYTFGGDLSSIDFYYQQDRRLSEQRLVGTASTWYLTKIEIPGGETIDFTYEKHGFPIVKKDVHTKLYVHYNEMREGWGLIPYDEEVYSNESDYTNLSLTILNPSYLTRIENSMSGDFLTFDNRKTDELESDVTHDEFVGVMGGMTGLDMDSFIDDQNYHMGVARIIGPTKRINFDYRCLPFRDSLTAYPSSVMPPSAEPKERLRLDRVLVRSILTDSPGMVYHFRYDSLTLPHSYNSKFTDHWGYYTALRHHDILKNRTGESDTFYQTTLNALMDQYRAPNAYRMQAEILKEIEYPTGGITKFEYEPHYYNREATCFDSYTQQYVFAVRPAEGMAGGLRIKTITDSLHTGAVERRTFSYNNSGILCGKPLYGAIGRTLLNNTFTDPGLFGDPCVLDIGFSDVTYRMGSERIINQLSPSSGNHVTYGSVTETFADNSSVTYHYSDHTAVPDNAPLWTESNINCSLLLDPVTSMQLGRGLLTRVDYKDASGNLVRRDSMTYRQPPADEYILSISKRNPAPSGALKRVAVNRIAYYHPRLLSQTVTTWPDSSGSPIIDTLTYTYNNHRRIIGQTRTRGADSETEQYLRAEDITGGFYPGMTAGGYGAQVIEQLVLRNGDLTGASLTCWCRDSTTLFWVPTASYMAELSAPMQISQWTQYNGSTFDSAYGDAELSYISYDSHRNITEAIDHAGHHDYYQWDENGMNLMSLSNAPRTLYLDFEDNASTVDGGYLSDKARTGVLSLSFTAPPNTPYVVDYRIKRNQDWVYERQVYTGSGMQIGESGCLLDGVRIYPEGAMIQTYTYFNPGMVRSLTDARGVSQSYTYDWARRLESTYDNAGNVEASYLYHYRNNDRDSFYMATDPYAGINVITQTAYLVEGGLSPYREESRFDDFGRKSEIRKKEASTNGYDIVQNFAYDSKGRLSRTVIPKPSFLLAPLQFDYSETMYDGTPLNRIRKEYGPGQNWRIGHHSVRYEYLSNSTEDNAYAKCRRYAVSFGADGSAIVTNDGLWPDGSLELMKTTDEDDQVVYSFKDMWGQEVLRRVVSEDEAGQTAFLDTYYIYDLFGRLNAVLPPSLSRAIQNIPGSLTEQNCPEIQQFAYLYRYDHRDRCIAKRLPGCAWVYYVYDETDRAVFEQDGKDRSAGRWKFTLTDSQGRECLTGTVTQTMNAFADPLAGLTLDVSRTYPLTTGGMYGYSLTGFTLPNPEILTVCWWDDYSFLGKWSIPSANNSSVSYTVPQSGEPYGLRYEASSTGLQTGMLTKVIGTNVGNQYLWGVNYYDEKGRIVQSRKKYLLGKTLSSRYGYNFTGSIVAQENVYHISNQLQLTDSYTYTYDNCGRPLRTTHRFNGGAPVVIHDLGYDPVGRISSDARNGHRVLVTQYSYNTRDWMTAIACGHNGDTFSETLCYEASPDPRFTPRWGGDIGSQQWSVDALHGGTTHKYLYTYDNLSRLKEARHTAIDTTFRFTRRYGYDDEGNLLSLYKEQRSETGVPVDTMSYYYEYQGNRMTHRYVTNPPPGLMPMFMEAFSYDSTGNMTQALLDNIGLIDYNLLKLPQQITVMGTDQQIISIIYSATGEKLSRSVNGPHIILNSISRIYMGPIILENDEPSLLLFDGGFITISSGITGYTGTYHFFVKDHQGNIRAIVSEDGDLERTYHYAPYGEIVSESSGGNAPSNRYKYSGKEWDDLQDAYDFGARMYMPAYARFTTMDPSCEQYYSLSPYAYCAANPVNLVDPDGNNPFLSGAVSALVDFGLQVGVKMFEGNGFFDAVKGIDYSSVVAAGIEGAIAPSTAWGRVAKVVITAVDAGVDFKAEIGWETIWDRDSKKGKEMNAAITDFISGALGGDLGECVTRGISRGLKAEASSSATATLTKEMKQAKKRLSNFANKESTKKGMKEGIGVVSKMGGEVVKIATEDTSSRPFVFWFEQGEYDQDPHGMYFNPF